MRKTTMIAMVVVVMAVVPAMAQQGDPPPGVEAAFRQVAGFLQLDETQVGIWQGLIDTHRAEEQLIREDMRAIEEALAELFEGADPDPAAIGELVLERRALGEELRVVHATYNESFRAMLDEEQEGRLRAVAHAARIQPVIPAFKLFELIPRD